MYNLKDRSSLDRRYNYSGVVGQIRVAWVTAVLSIPIGKSIIVRIDRESQYYHICGRCWARNGIGQYRMGYRPTIRMNRKRMIVKISRPIPIVVSSDQIHALPATLQAVYLSSTNPNDTDSMLADRLGVTKQQVSLFRKRLRDKYGIESKRCLLK